jgi:hypothetical protein
MSSRTFTVRAYHRHSPISTRSHKVAALNGQSTFSTHSCARYFEYGLARPVSTETVTLAGGLFIWYRSRRAITIIEARGNQHNLFRA